MGRIPHQFGNFEGTYVFPNQEDGRGQLREFMLVRSPKGDPFSHQTDNPDRIIYRMEEDGDCTYMSTLSHAVTYERKNYRQIHLG